MDDGQNILSTNLFAYCINNPVMYVDYSGYFSWKNNFFNSRWFVSNSINVLIGLLVGGGFSVVSAFFKNQARKYGEKAAATIFSDSIKRSNLVKSLGSSIANKISWAVSFVFSILMIAMDPGGAIFDWLDARDKYPRNGYLNL